MKKIVLKSFKVVYWILMSILVIITSIGLTAMLDLATEEGGAPGYNPGAIFNFWLIITIISGLSLIILVNLEPIANFFRRKYLWWRYKKVI